MTEDSSRILDSMEENFYIAYFTIGSKIPFTFKGGRFCQ